MAIPLTPLQSLRHRPLLIYHSAIPSSTSASDIEQHLKGVGVVSPQWRYTMYSITHFHSTSHEVLCVSHGRARLCFGGEENPERVEPVVKKGDVMVVPAGVGHRLMDDLDGGFEMVGAYPEGHDWDMCYGKEDEQSKVKMIEQLSWFDRDPLYGHEGPTLEP
ncbi:MAG: hypothetical protein M1817_003245 [Caeruleum heppii]|nr:MAG: hypothetical protein M1817_003245 [Caeruleum heppii]